MGEDRGSEVKHEYLKLDRRHRRNAYFKRAVKTWASKVFWRALYFTLLARPYAKTMCRLSLYQSFPDGRCCWCGKMHCKPRKGLEGKTDE